MTDLIKKIKLALILALCCESIGVASSGLSLQSAVNEGLRANLDLMAAKYNISLAEADQLTAGLWNNPSLLVDTVFQPFGGNWNQTSAGGPRQYDTVLSYPFDVSGKRSAATKSAQSATRVAEATFQDAVRQKVLQIRLAYIDLLTFKEQLSLAYEKEANLNRLVQMIQNKIGRKTLLPLLQRRAQLARDQAVLDTKQRESAVRTAETALLLVLGNPLLESSPHLTTKLRDFRLADLPTIDRLISRALDNRPDLSALRLSSSKADFDAQLAHAQVWDNFNVTAGVSHQGPNSANPNDPNSTAQKGAFSWSAGVTIPLPVFNRNQGNIQKAVVAKSQAEKQIEALLLSLHQEIDTDYRQLKLNRELIEEYEKKQLKSARQVRDSQQTLFGTGGSSLLDYFDAVSAYNSTLSSYYDVVGEYRRSWARLNAAIGKDVLP